MHINDDHAPARLEIYISCEVEVYNNNYYQKDLIMRVSKTRLQWALVLLGMLTVIGLAPAEGHCPVSPEIPGSNACIRPGDTARGIPFRDLGAGGGDRGQERFNSSTQVIVTSYTFECCGVVRLWRTYMEPGGGRENGEYDITFQVWRPSGSGADQSDCYRLVGENSFRGITLGAGGLVCEGPATMGDEIAVQPGDVVGFYTRHGSGGERGVQIDDGYGSESVWYGERLVPSGTGGGGDSQCVGSAAGGGAAGGDGGGGAGGDGGGGAGGDGGSLQEFTNHAPILSVTLESENCLQTATTGGALNNTDTDSRALSIPAVIGVIFGGVATLFLLTQLVIVAVLCLRKHCHLLRTRKCAEFQLGFNETSLSYNVNYHQAGHTMLDGSSVRVEVASSQVPPNSRGAGGKGGGGGGGEGGGPGLMKAEASIEGDYAAPWMLRKHPVVARTNTTSTCHYVEPNAHIPIPTTTATLNTMRTCSTHSALSQGIDGGTTTTTTTTTSSSSSGSGSILVTPYAVSGNFTPHTLTQNGTGACTCEENIILKANRAYGSPQKYVSILS